MHAGTADDPNAMLMEPFRTFTDFPVFFVGLENAPNPGTVMVEVVTPPES